MRVALALAVIASLVPAVARAAPLSPPRALRLALGAEARRRVEPAPLIFAFIPFGVGQFANEEPVKGALFLAGEAIAFGTFAGALAAFEANKVDGGFLEGGRFRDPELARTLQTVYLVAFWTGAALAGTGIVEALVSRPSSSVAGLTLSPNTLVLRF